MVIGRCAFHHLAQYISPDDSTGCVSIEADGWLPTILLIGLVADFMIVIAEDAFLANGIIPALTADLFGIKEHGDVFDHDFKCHRHRFIQAPCDSSQDLRSL